MAPCNGTQQWHYVHSPNPSTLQWHHSTRQWHPTIAPSHGTTSGCHVQSAKVVRRPSPLLEVRTPIAIAIWGKMDQWKKYKTRPQFFLGNTTPRQQESLKHIHRMISLYFWKNMNREIGRTCVVSWFASCQLMFQLMHMRKNQQNLFEPSNQT